MVTPLCTGQGYVSVGDSADEFISIHALGRERLLVLSCGLPSHALKILFFARWETREFFVPVFYTPLAKCDFNRSLIGAGHKSPTVEWALYTKGGGGAPNELATFRVHDAVVDFVEQSVWRTRNYAASNPTSAWETLRPMLAKIAARNRFFPEFWKVSKRIHQMGSIGDRSGKVWLGSSWISNFWPFIVTGLRRTVILCSPHSSFDEINDSVVNSERGEFVRGSDPPLVYSAHSTAGDWWRAPIRLLLKTHLATGKLRRKPLSPPNGRKT